MVETVINYEYSVKNLFSPHNSAKNCQKENKARKEWTSTNIIEQRLSTRRGAEVPPIGLRGCPPFHPYPWLL